MLSATMIRTTDRPATIGAVRATRMPKVWDLAVEAFANGDRPIYPGVPLAEIREGWRDVVALFEREEGEWQKRMVTALIADVHAAVAEQRVALTLIVAGPEIILGWKGRLIALRHGSVTPFTLL
jgi:hypothetical protein